MGVWSFESPLVIQENAGYRNGVWSFKETSGFSKENAAEEEKVHAGRG